MRRANRTTIDVAELDLSACRPGPVLAPLEELSEPERRAFAGWQMPLAPRGGFHMPSGLAVVEEGGRKVLAFGEAVAPWVPERALLAPPPHLRDATIVAEFRPVDAEAGPHMDRPDAAAALAGVVCRVETSRRHYYFGVEGRRRVVLYRRNDDEWHVLAAQDVTVPDGYVTLEVNLDGDGIRCRCAELGVELFCTDTAFRAGAAGFRSLGRSRLARLRIAQTPAQQARDAARARHRAEAELDLGRHLPDAVLLRTLDLAELGGQPTFADFAEPGRFDVLACGPDRARALTAEGRELWTLDEGLGQVVFSKSHGPQGRLIYALTGMREHDEVRDVRGRCVQQVVQDEMLVVAGRTGEVLARAKTPPVTGPTRHFDFSPRGVAFTSHEGTDIILREWRKDKGGGGLHLWAYDRQLNPLWAHQQTGAWYGHHHALAACDIDGDGREELLAGGVMYDAAGSVLWTHDLADEVLRIYGGEHYDSVVLGDLAGEADDDPVAVLVGSSAGAYVVDALTGRTRAVHRIGHAQGSKVAKVRPDLPGREVLLFTRWGNMGILTLLSGRGERLWDIQPDYVGQGTCPVHWPPAEAQLIWANASGPVQGLYDGFGRRVKELPALREAWGPRMRKDVASDVVRLGRDKTEYLALTFDGRVHLFGPAR